LAITLEAAKAAGRFKMKGQLYRWTTV